MLGRPINADVKWLTPLRLEVPGTRTDPGASLMYLAEDFVVQIGWRVCLAPKGMATDGASIPRVFWRLIGSPWTGKYRRPAIFHDAGYKGLLQIKSVDGDAVDVRLTRDETDGLFLALMQAEGANWFLRQTIYRAVRVCGWASWQETPTP